MLSKQPGHVYQLWLENDVETFKLNCISSVTPSGIFDIWRDTLALLAKGAKKGMLPTYIEEKDDGLFVAGYVIYPHGSGWIMIDRGCTVPTGKGVECVNEYLPNKSTELPAAKVVWQSHWYVSGRDLTELAHDLGAAISFADAIDTPPDLTIMLRKGAYDIVVGKRKYRGRVDAVHKSGISAQRYLDRFEDFKRHVVDSFFIPLRVDPDFIELAWIARDERENTFITISYLDQVRQIDVLLETDRSSRPYMISESPRVYQLSSRFGRGVDSIGDMIRSWNI